MHPSFDDRACTDIVQAQLSNRLRPSVRCRSTLPANGSPRPLPPGRVFPERVKRADYDDGKSCADDRVVIVVVVVVVVLVGVVVAVVVVAGGAAVAVVVGVTRESADACC